MKFPIDQGINQNRLFNGVNDPVFLYTRFLVNFVFVGQFFSIVSRRKYFYDQIRGANTSGIVHLKRVANDTTIGLDYRIYRFIFFGMPGQSHIKWRSIGLTGLIFEVIEKALKRYPEIF